MSDKLRVQTNENEGKMNSRAKYWIELAEYDMETAKVMHKGKRYLYVGFMCHQTVEKGLKAILAKIKEEETPPKIHNLIRLSKMAGINIELNEEQHRFISSLNPLNLETRYPEDRESLHGLLKSRDCESLLSKTEELLQWIKQQL